MENMLSRLKEDMKVDRCSIITKTHKTRITCVQLMAYIVIIAGRGTFMVISPRQSDQHIHTSRRRNTRRRNASERNASRRNASRRNAKFKTSKKQVGLVKKPIKNMYCLFLRFLIGPVEKIHISFLVRKVRLLPNVLYWLFYVKNSFFGVKKQIFKIEDKVNKRNDFTRHNMLYFCQKAPKVSKTCVRICAFVGAGFTHCRNLSYNVYAIFVESYLNFNFLGLTEININLFYFVFFRAVIILNRLKPMNTA
jgi:hypothetical protein